ncbi:rhodanese-like domain-containing protein [Leeia sp. TBRC 13508]|uniref:Rhodanese-like domain-containing protein n=1 Tax=Leeia speluncae TaxID=2884804 RepID=A0ABS8D909_9NEIS|nr:rhodanese-like domain-containing protein [Leeia speluncae]MCB6184113.1 rhodanese-like domain-containing protein [Leeia speluncae]
MSESNQILLLAKKRAEQLNLPYAGAVEPKEAHQLLHALPNIKIVDVRTSAEWNFVGRVPSAVEIEWKTFPGMVPNPHFLEQLKRQVDAENIVLFLCRTGARSHDAAALAQQHGYSAAYNILEGFEGDKDSEGHRGKVNGWKAHQLPWIQG